MNLASLIDEIVPWVPSGYSRTGTNSIASLVEQCIDDLLDYDSPNRVYRGLDNQGFPPYLYTTAGTYRYSLVAANLSCGQPTRPYNGTDYNVEAWKPLRVFVDATNFDYGKRWVGEASFYTWENPYSNEYTRTRIAEIPISKHERYGDEAASIEFIEDPGTTTDRFFVEFTWRHPRLTAETIPLFVPDQIKEGIKDYVIGTVNKYANGELGGRLEMYNRKWKPEFQARQRTNGGAVPQTVQPRYC